MDIKATVIKTFNNTVQTAQVNSELKKSLLTHPNMKTFVHNMYSELIAVEATRAQKQKPRLKASTIESYVKDMTNVFIQQFNQAAEFRIMSELEKIRLKAEKEKQKNLEQSADGNLTGEYLELKDQGVMIGETEVKSL